MPKLKKLSALDFKSFKVKLFVLIGLYELTTIKLLTCLE